MRPPPIPDAYRLEDEIVFKRVEEQPEYPGGPQAMLAFIRQHRHVSKAAIETHVEGRVIVTFTVESDGRLTNIEVVRSLSPGCDEEAVRVIQAMPRWKPGKQSGRAVRVKYNLPISFTLE